MLEESVMCLFDGVLVGKESEAQGGREGGSQGGREGEQGFDCKMTRT